MIDLYSIHEILSLISVSLGLFLGFWVYFSNRQAKINRYFSIICVSFSLFWVHQFFTTSFLAKISLDYATWNLRLGYFGAAITALAIFYFCLYFPRESKMPLWVKNLITYLCVFLSLLSLSPFLVQKALVSEKYGVLEGGIYGWGKYFYFLPIIFIVLGSVLMVIKKYFFVTLEEKLETKYFLFGFGLAVVTNVVGNVLYPLTKGIIHPVGNYSLLIFLGITALAITRYHLFEIKVLLTELLVGVMGTILLVLPFVIKTTLPMRILMIGVFLVFCFIGYLLIRYTHREVHQKEILEQAVRERTKELEKAKNIAEKAKNIAEQRAREIEKRKADLEHFYKLTVGRELKMIELKKKIRELEEKREREKGT